MEISEVRRQVRAILERAPSFAEARRERNDAAKRAFERCLDQTAVPIIRQIASALRAEGHLFTIFTPAGSVRLMSERRPTDFVEIGLDTSGYLPRVVGHTTRGGPGANVTEYEQTVGNGDPAALTEQDVLSFVLREIELVVDP